MSDSLPPRLIRRANKEAFLLATTRAKDMSSNYNRPIFKCTRDNFESAKKWSPKNSTDLHFVHTIRAREVVHNGPDQQQRESCNRLADAGAMEESKNISPRQDDENQRGCRERHRNRAHNVSLGWTEQIRGQKSQIYKQERSAHGPT
jgi:hypothetical protein